MEDNKGIVNAYINVLGKRIERNINKFFVDDNNNITLYTELGFPIRTGLGFNLICPCTRKMGVFIAANNEVEYSCICDSRYRFNLAIKFNIDIIKEGIVNKKYDNRFKISMEHDIYFKSYKEDFFLSLLKDSPERCLFLGIDNNPKVSGSLVIDSFCPHCGEMKREVIIDNDSTTKIKCDDCHKDYYINCLSNFSLKIKDITFKAEDEDE